MPAETRSGVSSPSQSRGSRGGRGGRGAVTPPARRGRTPKSKGKGASSPAGSQASAGAAAKEASKEAPKSRGKGASSPAGSQASAKAKEASKAAHLEEQARLATVRQESARREEQARLAKVRRERVETERSEAEKMSLEADRLEAEYEAKAASDLKEQAAVRLRKAKEALAQRTTKKAHVFLQQNREKVYAGQGLGERREGWSEARPMHRDLRRNPPRRAVQVSVDAAIARALQREEDEAKSSFGGRGRGTPVKGPPRGGPSDQGRVTPVKRGQVMPRQLSLDSSEEEFKDGDDDRNAFEEEYTQFLEQRRAQGGSWLHDVDDFAEEDPTPPPPGARSRGPMSRLGRLAPPAGRSFQGSVAGSGRDPVLDYDRQWSQVEVKMARIDVPSARGLAASFALGHPTMIKSQRCRKELLSYGLIFDAVVSGDIGSLRRIVGCRMMGLMYAHSAPLESGKPNWDLAEVLEPPEVAENNHDEMRVVFDYNRKRRKAQGMPDLKPPKGGNAD